jgi:GNAT superfamily N-acetyltransferase
VSTFDIREVVGGSADHDAVLCLADDVLAQRRYVVANIPTADDSHILGAFDADGCAGFVRYYVQVIGAEEGRPPIVLRALPLREGFVEAFGVAPRARRSGIGTALQEAVRARCRDIGCYQVRSRSPVGCVENYALKIVSGYGVHPSGEDDSYFFVKTL